MSLENCVKSCLDKMCFKTTAGIRACAFNQPSLQVFFVFDMGAFSNKTLAQVMQYHIAFHTIQNGILWQNPAVRREFQGLEIETSVFLLN